MDVGSFTSGLLTGLREGVEAALIVSIILAYLARTGNRRHFAKIWAGTFAAIAVSFLAGLALFVTIGGFEEPYEQIFEGLDDAPRGRRRDVDAVLDAAPGGRRAQRAPGCGGQGPARRAPRSALPCSRSPR